jgi:hypothetical protein
MPVCDCPIPEIDCDGAWDCDNVEVVMYEVLAYYDTNSDGHINPEDNIDPAHYEDFSYACDTNYDGSVSPCELY